VTTNPPTLTGGRVDPVWGTAGKALLGAGLGAGTGGLMSLLQKHRRKHWLRNMLMGGWLGGGIGAGTGMLMHGAEALEQGPASEQLSRQKQKLVSPLRGFL
jgi:hypothetical protein